MGLYRRHVSHVKLEGLQVQIPPGRPTNQNSGRPASTIGTTDDVTLSVKDFIVDELVAPDARLVIIPRSADSKPKVWLLHRLKMRSVGLYTAMPFESQLTNAVPPGEITTSGTFGPWARSDPGETPLAGDFTFDHADLSVFKGLSGTLSARGSYRGQLERLEVDGETETPDFSVKISGHAVPLSTTYHAIVDGTNGDTTLDPVKATFVKSSLVARGGVYDVKGIDGRHVTLQITMEQGRLEDVMQLAVNSPKPPMVGSLSLLTNFKLPPGDADVVQQLQLDGAFAISNGRFTNPEVQTKVNELSSKASGKKSRTERASAVASDFRGSFTLNRGTLVIPKVAFDVPGAVIELTGQYALEPETIDFSGHLFMDAKISQTTTGFKSLLLKAVDPLFRRNGKTVVPIRINGTRKDPHFGVDVKRVFQREKTD